MGEVEGGMIRENGIEICIISSDGYIAQGGIVDARVLHEALAHLDVLVEATDVKIGRASCRERV